MPRRLKGEVFTATASTFLVYLKNGIASEITCVFSTTGFTWYLFTDKSFSSKNTVPKRFFLEFLLAEKFILSAVLKLLRRFVMEVVTDPATD